MSDPVKIDSIPDARTKARLEFTYEKVGPGEWTVFYELVVPLNKADCRGTFDHKPAKRIPKSWRMVYLSKDNCIRIPMGRSGCQTTNPDYPFYRDGTLGTPFRDGAHSQWDQEKLGVERYSITPRGIYRHAKPAKVIAA